MTMLDVFCHFWNLGMKMVWWRYETFFYLFLKKSITVKARCVCVGCPHLAFDPRINFFQKLHLRRTLLCKEVP